MKILVRNTIYFLKEMGAIFRQSLGSNILSMFSMGLIFFILNIIVSSLWIGAQVVEVLEKEAEVSVYFNKDIDEKGMEALKRKILSVDGVLDLTLISEAESHERMAEILGKESEVLNFFDESPFAPFIEVSIDLEKVENMGQSLEKIDGVEYIRDNKDVLEDMKRIVGIIETIGYFVIVAVGITTLVIISHIIRLGIYNNMDQINTLRLLGAPEFFIGIPHVLSGLTLTLGGGILSLGLIQLMLNYFAEFVGDAGIFIGMASMNELMNGLVYLVIILGILLGVVGSLIGLNSSKE